MYDIFEIIKNLQTCHTIHEIADVNPMYFITNFFKFRKCRPTSCQKNVSYLQKKQSTSHTKFLVALKFQIICVGINLPKTRGAYERKGVTPGI